MSRHQRWICNNPHQIPNQYHNRHRGEIGASAVLFEGEEDHGQNLFVGIL